MSAEIRRLALALLLVASTFASLRAQDLDYAVRRAGNAGFDVDLVARDQSVLDVIGALARETGLVIKTTDAEITAELDAERIDVAVKSRPLVDVLRDLAEAAAHTVRVDLEARTIHLARIPRDDEEGAYEFYRRQGVAALAEALAAGTGDDQLEYLLRGAELDLRGGDDDVRQGLQKLLRFLDDDHVKRHPEGPEACLRGARAALRVGATAEVWAFYDRFLRNFPEHPAVSQARILAARARLQEGIFIEAIRLLESVRRDGTRGDVPERDALVAELLLAEAYWRAGEPAKARLAVQDLEARHRRDHQDLLALIPYVEGLCFRDEMDHEKAALSFRHAAHRIVQAARRARALRHESEALLAVGRPFQALTSARVAESVGPDGPDAFALARLRAHSYEALDLEDKALEILEDLAGRVDELLPAAARDGAESAALLEEIAAMRLRRGEIDDAMALFGTLAKSPSLARRARYMVARCLHEKERHAEAVAILDELLARPGEGELELAIRELRGDCFMALRLFERAVENYREDDR
ncbi:MAG: hypothetical protein R3F20_07440 [Planctomycetota bacterium]